MYPASHALLSSLGFATRIIQIAGEAVVDEEPDSHFKKLLAVLDQRDEMGVDADAAGLVDDTWDQVRRAVEMLRRVRENRSDRGHNNARYMARSDYRASLGRLA